ncbi:acyl-CoA mutase large subunit family protein [Actinophytocola sp.]|uniref:acyl-CoA mutase large subunit family protein n=1 Tax=Actinophytocola sp. TaxID=1872138 RepID=UPI003D6B284E
MGRMRDWLDRHPEAADAAEVVTDSDLPVRVVYASDDVAPGVEERNGLPGEAPYARGIYPTMYRGRLWTMRLYSGLETAVDTNKRFRFLLEQGQTGLSVALDLPTQMGYDSDAPQAHHEVGRTGVAICSAQDMCDIFDGIPLEKVSTSFTINATAAILLAFYVVAAERQGVPWERVSGTIQNDILKEYIARKTYIFPPEPSLRLVADAMEFCAEHLPRFNSISVCGYHMRQAGCDAVQEVAFTLANALVYVERLVRRGLDIDDFAPRISFNFSTMSELFEEVAKHRACRRVWARLIEDRYQPKDPRSTMMRFFSGGDGTSLTAVEPLNNIVRVTMHQLGIILGGAQAVHTVAYDEAIGLPTEESALVALRTQQILAHETGVTKTVDPLAGSYYVESLTDEIERRVLALIEQIEERGGMPELIATRWVQDEIEQRAYEWELAIARGERKVVGVNAFAAERAGATEPTFPLPEAARADLEQRQIDRLNRHRADRDEVAVSACLDRIRVAAAEPDTPLMPLLLDGARAGATVGEICDVLRAQWGTFDGSGP